ncbi:MAG: ribosome maturation factor RimM [Pseudomonadota bacterium]|nr:MAG: 16S rRNA processing protein RimM [Pseudomonadota bacterium]
MTSTLEIARVLGAHGLAGAVKVKLHFAESDALTKVSEVDLVLPSGERRTLAVASARRAGDVWLVSFAGVDDRDAAAALRGARVEVQRSALPALEPDTVYLVDLVGADVVAPDGVVGRVVEVWVNPSVDSVVIEQANGKRVELVLLPEYVARIDVEGRRIELSSRDGLIE